MNVSTRRLLSKVYFGIPFMKFVFRILRKCLRLPPFLTHYMRFKGIIEVPLNSTASFKMHHYGFEIENSLFWYGINGWEESSLKIWLELSKKCKVILDIGANTGVYALISKAINPECEVYAFEPVKRIYSRLVSNIKLNDCNIVPIEKAVSNFDGNASIYDPGTDHLYSVTVNKNLNDSNVHCSKVDIQTITLSTFIKEWNLNSIDLIKIDVETHEPEVLEGFGNYLQDFLPVILIEILNEDVCNKVNKVFKDLDYVFYSIDEKRGCKFEKQIIPRKDRNYLLIPKIKSEIINRVSSHYLY